MTTLLLLLSLNLGYSAELTSAVDVLKLAYQKSPELAAAKARAEAEAASVRSKYSLNNPRIGLMRETNLTAEQRQMGAMESWSFSQEILFPTKYFALGSMQDSKATAANEQYLDKRLEIRQRVLSQYYNYYTSSRIEDLLKAQRETLREISRIAEARRATGAAPQQDEMKAHVEQTKIENEILLQRQEVVEVLASLNVLLDRDSATSLPLAKQDLRTPKLIEALDKIESSAAKHSKIIAAEQAGLSEASSARTLARMGYLPDFMLSYRKPFGANAPDNAYAIGIELSIPLWFFAKQNGETSAAAAKVIEAENRLQQTVRQVEAETKTLSSKVKTLAELLKIYETALIPQSTSALNSSRAAYSAGRVGFQELLDAERSLYSVRIEYYKTLARYVDTLTSLERVVGSPVSDLAMDGDST